jgi:hypothetical protein
VAQGPLSGAAVCVRDSAAVLLSSPSTASHPRRPRCRHRRRPRRRLPSPSPSSPTPPSTPLAYHQHRHRQRHESSPLPEPSRAPLHLSTSPRVGLLDRHANTHDLHLNGRRRRAHHTRSHPIPTGRQRLGRLAPVVPGTDKAFKQSANQDHQRRHAHRRTPEGAVARHPPRQDVGLRRACHSRRARRRAANGRQRWRASRTSTRAST